MGKDKTEKMEITEIRRTKRKKREAEKRKKTGKRKTENDKERNGIKPQALYNHAQGFLVTKKRSGKTGSFFHLSLKTIRRAVCKASRRKCPIPRSRAFCICRRKAIPLPCSCSCRPLRQPSRSDICGRFEHDCRIFSTSSALRSGGFGRFWLPWASAGKHRADRQTRKHHTKCSQWFRNTPSTTDNSRKSELLSLFSPRSIRHFPNCRRKQTKTEILFSYLIIFEVNNRFVAFSIDKNFQKSTEIGSQFHNLPTAGCPSPLLLPPCPPTCTNPLLPSLSPCDRLSRLFLSCCVLILPKSLPPPLNHRFPHFGLYIRRGLRPASPNFAFPAPAGRLPQPASSPAVSSNLPQPASSLSFSLRPPLPACSPAVSLPPCPACLPSIPQSAPFSLSSRRPTYTAVFLTRLPFPITFLSPYPPAAYLASLPSVSLLPRPYSSEVTTAASQPLLFSLRRPFRRSFSLSDKLFTIKKDVPKARLFLQAFFYSLHSSSAAKTSGLQPNTSCQIPRILRPHQTSVRINMRLPENIICR